MLKFFKIGRIDRIISVGRIIWIMRIVRIVRIVRIGRTLWTLWTMSKYKQIFFSAWLPLLSAREATSCRGPCDTLQFRPDVLQYAMRRSVMCDATDCSVPCDKLQCRGALKNLDVKAPSW